VLSHTRSLALITTIALLVTSCSGDDDSPTSPSPVGPLWTASGVGNDVRTKPVSAQRLRITAQYSGFGSNFIVRCDGSGVVNELLGTTWNATSYTGTHATPNCTQIEVRDSTGVSWQITEVR
jgi:hypothetical protein